MSTIGESLARTGRLGIGVGASIRPQDVPQEEDIIYQGWQHGMIVSHAPEDIPQDAGQVFTDLQVDEGNRLIRAPGVTLKQDCTPRKAFWIFSQSNVDYSSELVIIDPPYIGYASTGNFTFVNVGIVNTSAEGWAVLDYLGTLLFSDGVTKSYTRAPNTGAVTNVSASIVAQAFANAFGRIFAGGFVDPVSGYQALGVRWNDTSGVITGWSGLGSGSQFLLDNNLTSDRIVAMIPIGFQTLGVLCRKSLWVGYSTGNDNAPADFQIRFIGHGCIAQRTACATPWGIVYLTDKGVALFDLNTSNIISHVIDDKLLPIDFSRIQSYSATFVGDRYILSTPLGQWVCEFPNGFSSPLVVDSPPPRWFFRSFIADSVVQFTDQGVGIYWNTAVGQWNQQTLEWVEMVIGEENASPNVYYGAGTKVGFEDFNSMTNLGAAMTPVWVSRQDLKAASDLIETHWLEVRFKSISSSDVTFSTMDTDGNLTNSLTRTFPNTSGVRKTALIGTSTMLGMGSELQIVYGANANIGIERIRRVTMKDGPTTASSVAL